MKQVADILKSVFGEENLARFGNDHFVIVDFDDENSIAKVEKANQLVAQIDLSFKLYLKLVSTIQTAASRLKRNMTMPRLPVTKSRMGQKTATKSIRQNSANKLNTPSLLSTTSMMPFKMATSRSTTSRKST